MSDTRDPVDAIKRLYFRTTKATVVQDLERAIALLRAMPDEDTRARAAVYMDGLAQMRSEWGVTAAPPAAGPRRRGSGRTPTR